jgi:hypothetical protein
VPVVDQHEHRCAGLSAAQADVVQPAVVPQGELVVGVDLVVADPEVAVDQWDARRGGLGPGGVSLGRGTAGQGAVRPDAVVAPSDSDYDSTALQPFRG